MADTETQAASPATGPTETPANEFVGRVKPPRTAKQLAQLAAARERAFAMRADQVKQRAADREATMRALEEEARRAIPDLATLESRRGQESRRGRDDESDEEVIVERRRAAPKKRKKRIVIVQSDSSEDEEVEVKMPRRTKRVAPPPEPELRIDPQFVAAYRSMFAL